MEKFWIFQNFEIRPIYFIQITAPDFVSTLEDENHVYFFFRESAVEYINCGKVSCLKILYNYQYAFRVTKDGIVYYIIL